MKLNDNIIYFDAYDLERPKLYLLDCLTNDVFILVDDMRLNFLKYIKGDAKDDEYIKEFIKWGFILVD